MPAVKTLVRVNTGFRFDPTRTTGLRARFVREMLRRFGDLSKLMRLSIVDNDVFAIIPRDSLIALAALAPRAYEFKRAPEKVQAFMDWLKVQEAAGVLQTSLRPTARFGGGFVETAWMNTFIETAYQQGIRAAREKLRREGVDIPAFSELPGGGISALMNQPFHADRVGLIYSRTFEDLKTVTSVMDAQIRQRLSEGLTTGLARGIAEGKNPRRIGKELFESLNDRVEHIGEARATLIARTEIIRAHHVATITEFRQAGIEGVRVKGEWLTAGDGRVCPICEGLEGKIFSLDEIEPMIPRHPQCRCTALPVI